jgi:hypothetical protein
MHHLRAQSTTLELLLPKKHHHSALASSKFCFISNRPLPQPKISPSDPAQNVQQALLEKKLPKAGATPFNSISNGIYFAFL